MRLRTAEGIVVEENKEVERGYAAYLQQLQDELASLERFPRSSYSQGLILAVSVFVLVAGFFGFSLIPVPAYVLLPFVILPGRTLLLRERTWRVGQRTIREQIRLIEQRRRPR